MKISGKIVDFSREPLVGVHIMLITGAKANKIGTYTNFDGDFIFESPDFGANDKFQISYIGFAPKIVLAKDLVNATIVLSEDTTVLNAVVVTAPKKNNSVATPQNSIAAAKKPIQKIKDHLVKNKYTYAGASGLLGMALIALTFKK
jgi:hypothetical protein